MRWPWSKSEKVEKRETGGDYSAQIVQFAEARVAGLAADAGKSAAVEAASGLLSRAFMSAKVEAADWAQECLHPRLLGQIGRSLIRRGDYLAAIRLNDAGLVKLITCSDFWWHGGEADEDTWHVRCTAYGPSTSTTWYLPQDAVAFLTWGSETGSLYRGRSPMNWASQTSRLNAESE